MSVTNEELARAAEAIHAATTRCSGTVDGSVCLKCANSAARAAASVLRPEGSVLIAGTCAGCRWSEEWIDRMFSAEAVEVLMCANALSPCGAKVVRPDFTCALFQHQETP